jgi:hypothetical protein
LEGDLAFALEVRIAGRVDERQVVAVPLEAEDRARQGVVTLLLLGRMVEVRAPGVHRAGGGHRAGDVEQRLAERRLPVGGVTDQGEAPGVRDLDVLHGGLSVWGFDPGRRFHSLAGASA